MLKRRTDVDRIVVRLVATLPVDQTEHGELRTVVAPVVRSVVDDDGPRAQPRMVGGPQVGAGISTSLSASGRRPRCSGGRRAGGRPPRGRGRARGRRRRALAAGLRLPRGATADAARRGAGAGARRRQRQRHRQRRRGAGTGARARTASTASRGQRLISRRLGVARWRPGEKRVSTRRSPRPSGRASSGPARATSRSRRSRRRPRPRRSARGAAVGRADAAEPDVHAAEPRGKDAVRAAPPQPGRRAPALLSIPPRAASSPVATPPTPPPARQRSSSEGELGAAFRERGERIERAGRQADGLAGAAGDFRALAAARRRRAEQRRKRWF